MVIIANAWAIAIRLLFMGFSFLGVNCFAVPSLGLLAEYVPVLAWSEPDQPFEEL